SPSEPLPYRVLAYLPSRHREFYGGGVVRRLAETHPRPPFVGVGGLGHPPAGLPHGESPRSGGTPGGVPPGRRLLVVTKHDGMPRMVLEALLRGRYVIYAWPFPGCWQARTVDEAQRFLDRFRLQEKLNYEGMRLARQFIEPDPGVKYARIIRQAARLP